MAAFERLRREHRITQREFSDALGIPERTFRSWKTRPPLAPRPPAPPPSPPRPPPVQRGRFDLAVIPPGIELTADTTDIDLFDIPLKLIAAQDPGHRDEELYEAFHLDVVEDARRIKDVVDAATRQQSFAQVVTDQGTPYCAHDAKEAYEARALEHAPTKEAAPTQKAPLERSFGTLKPLLAPLAALTSTLSALVPALRSEELAKTAGRYLISLAADAYRIGAESRIARTGAPPDCAAVRAAADDWTRRRREDHKSARLLLARIHEEYRMEGACAEFVRGLRRYRLEDVQEAERRLRTAACRCNAQVCDRYFAGIVCNVAEEAECRRQEARHLARERERLLATERQFEAEQQQLRSDPEYSIYRGLRIIATQWQPVERRLFENGRGMGFIDLRNGLTAVRDRRGPIAGRDEAEVVWRAWLVTAPADDAMRHAVRALWEGLLDKLFDKPERDFTAAAARLIINPPPLKCNPRSPRRVLRN